MNDFSWSKTEKKIAVLGRSGDFNRRALETLKIDYLVSPELGERKDTLKHRDSGLNHVLAKIAKEKGIELEAEHYLVKPCTVDDILKAIRLMAQLIPHHKTSSEMDDDDIEILE